MKHYYCNAVRMEIKECKVKYLIEGLIDMYTNKNINECKSNNRNAGITDIDVK